MEEMKSTQEFTELMDWHDVLRMWITHADQPPPRVLTEQLRVAQKKHEATLRNVRS